MCISILTLHWKLQNEWFSDCVQLEGNILIWTYHSWMFSNWKDRHQRFFFSFFKICVYFRFNRNTYFDFALTAARLLIDFWFVSNKMVIDRNLLFLYLFRIGRINILIITIAFVLNCFEQKNRFKDKDWVINEEINWRMCQRYLSLPGNHHLNQNGPVEAFARDKRNSVLFCGEWDILGDEFMLKSEMDVRELNRFIKNVSLCTESSQCNDFGYVTKWKDGVEARTNVWWLVRCVCVFTFFSPSFLSFVLFSSKFGY